MMSACKRNGIMPEWLTVSEAVEVINRHTTPPVRACDIYRHAFYGNLILSIYFQSPVILRRIMSGKRQRLSTLSGKDIIDKLCHLSSECLIKNDHRIINTAQENIIPPHYILDTLLPGREVVVLQTLLAATLRIPLPVEGHHNIHYGVTVLYDGHLCQVFEHAGRESRLHQQLALLPENLSLRFREKIKNRAIDADAFDYFPVYHFPDDACFVIRRDTLDAFMQVFYPPPKMHAVSAVTRISTPVSRLLWLACKNNPTISPLIAHPYKLISIFEQWAKAEGVTERLSGETLKMALTRGAPDASKLSL